MRSMYYSRDLELSEQSSSIFHTRVCLLVDRSLCCSQLRLSGDYLNVRVDFHNQCADVYSLTETAVNGSML